MLYLSILLYISFWFSFSFLVTSFKKGTAFNGISLIGGWLLFVIIILGIINIFSHAGMEGQKGIEVTVDQRESVHSGWDSDKELTLDHFFTRYPELASKRPDTQNFSWAWYFAMQETGDMKTAEKVKSYNDQLGEIILRSRWLEIFSPALTMQNIFNHYARTDLETHVNFLNRARVFHKDLKKFFYPYIFENRGFPHVDYNRVPHASFFSNESQAHSMGTILKLMGFILVLISFGLHLTKKN